MFRVLLVDDEPLILSGIKFMIDWKENGCEIVATARNGEQALEKIQELQPDIVITDLSMPVMGGIELLRKVSAEYPHIVFLVLTNLQEFASAQESLRLKATDYIVKSTLEPEVLEKALANAKKEAEKRRNLERVEMADHYINNSRSSLIQHAVAQFFGKSNLSKEDIALLNEEQMLQQFAAIHLQFSPTTISQESNLKQLVQWEFELVEKLSKNCFSSSLAIKASASLSAFIFCWNIPSFQEYKENIHNFINRLQSASQNITALSPYIQASSVYIDATQCEACREEINTQEMYAYFSSETVIIGQIPTLPPLKPLAVTSFAGRLKAELNNRNQSACAETITRIIHQVNSLPHEKSQAVWLCSELYTTLQECGFLESNLAEKSSVSTLLPFTHFVNCEQVGDWLLQVKAFIENNTSFFSSSKTDLITKAKQYTQAHTEEKITLQQVADHVGMSASYFSSLFKKETGQNFVDFSNSLKINHAKELIQSQKYRMNEISDMLGFENAYYFSKVFRRYTGLTPTDYQKDLQKNIS